MLSWGSYADTPRRRSAFSSHLRATSSEFESRLRHHSTPALHALVQSSASRKEPLRCRDSLRFGGLRLGLALYTILAYIGVYTLEERNHGADKHRDRRRTG